MKQSAEPAYEVYCNRCDVSFALGTRKCVHCGARTSRHRIRGQVVARSMPFDLRARRAEPPQEMALPPMVEEQAEMPEEEFRKRGVFSPMAVIYVLVAIGVVYRQCAGAPS